jgi:ABC-2 type transport system permease protein
MRRTIRLYLKFIAIAIRSRMQYRANFLMSFFGVVALNFVNLSLLWVMVRNFNSLAGWNYWEMAMLYGSFLLSHCVHAVFFWHLPRIEHDILRGNFDQYLLRPCSPLAQYLGKEVNYYGVPDFLLAMTIVSVSYSQLGLTWGVWKWVFFVMMVAAGFVIETAIGFVIGALAFWTGRSRALVQACSQFLWQLQNYPVDVFGRWYRLVVTSFLPFAFISYYPLTVLLEKQNAFDLPMLGFLSPLIALALLIISLYVWKGGIANYTSSGN